MQKDSMPYDISPELATLVTNPPQGNEWLHELKFDGYRIISYIHNYNVKIITRGKQDWTHKLPHLAQAIKNLNIANAILDGELVALNTNGHSNFELLQNKIHDREDKSLKYYLFDILHLDDKNLMSTPLIERKRILNKILPKQKNAMLHFSKHVITNSEEFFKHCCDLKLEGIVSKRKDSSYFQGRNKNWLKTKCSLRQEFVIGGYTHTDKERYFGSLLIGVYNDKKQFIYCGHVGTGFNRDSQALLWRQLQKIKTIKMPFILKPPKQETVTWVEPKLLIEVEFNEWTKQGILRHPSFKGVRVDKPAQEAIVEKPIKLTKAEKSNNANKFHLSHPDKVLYPQQNITKLALAEYYQQVSEWMLPYIIKRPLTLLRCPGGQRAQCFFQKHLIQETENIYSVKIKEKDKTDNYAYIKNVNGLFALVQLGVLEIHLWNSTISHIEKPDMFIFDLDPGPDVEWKKVIKTAFRIKENLELINLKSFVKTTGGKGLHIVVPIKRRYTWSQIKDFTKHFTLAMVEQYPGEYVAEMTKSKRVGKIYIDYQRNQRGATAVAPYSTRATANAPVSVPLSWDELTTRIKSDTFNIHNLITRLIKLKKDPWEGFFALKQTIKI